jgi:outer membrane autotransporter protein
VAVIELGLEAPIARNAHFSVSYVGQVGDGKHENSIQLGLGWKF